MRHDQVTLIQAKLDSGKAPVYRSTAELDDPEGAVELALESPVGRRWLRSLSDLDRSLADRLLAFESDFRLQRRDITLGKVVRVASPDAILAHGVPVAAGAAAIDLWNRFAGDPDQLVRVAVDVVSSGDPVAAENTLYLLVLDIVDPFALGARRTDIARAGLASADATTRSLAAEFLFNHDTQALAVVAGQLVYDIDERVRALTWSAGFRTIPDETYAMATAIVSDESADVQVRRSALSALGTHLDTSDVVDLLAFFVLHPSERLALDAANLMYRLHRQPTIATAAAESPHQRVREIGELLLDPYRGSPAAGGSRPGDPTSSDIFGEMIRQTEQRDPDQSG